MRFPAKTPKIVKRLFPNYIWDFSSSNKIIYLTFDDGPTPEVTDWALNTLKKFNAKATFFCIGKNIDKYPEIFNQIVSEKHSIGNHTQNHLKGWKTNFNTYLNNVEKCELAISDQLKVKSYKWEVGSDKFGVQSEQSSIINLQSSISNHQSPIINLFRPPYGQITPKLGKALIAKNYRIIMWDVIAYDWDNTLTSKTCFNNIIKNTKNGSIIVLHDSLKASKHLYNILPKTLEYFTSKGFKFKAI